MNLSSTDGQYLYFPLDESQPDAVSIVAWLNQLADHFGMDPDVRGYAELFLPVWLGDNDLEGIVQASLAWVKDNVAYVPDPLGTEYVISPLWLLNKIAEKGRAFGDCDDHCLLLASILRAFGIEAQIVGVKETPTSGWFDHVIVAIPSVNGSADPVTFLDPCAKIVSQPDYNNRELLITQ